MLDIGRVVVETTDSSITPLTVGDSRRTTDFVRCMYEAERSEVPYTHVSEELSNIQQVKLYISETWSILNGVFD